jgi:hypothetical protein
MGNADAVMQDKKCWCTTRNADAGQKVNAAFGLKNKIQKFKILFEKFKSATMTVENIISAVTSIYSRMAFFYNDI